MWQKPRATWEPVTTLTLCSTFPWVATAMLETTTPRRGLRQPSLRLGGTGVCWALHLESMQTRPLFTRPGWEDPDRFKSSTPALKVSSQKRQSLQWKKKMEKIFIAISGFLDKLSLDSTQVPTAYIDFHCFTSLGMYLHGVYVLCIYLYARWQVL